LTDKNEDTGARKAGRGFLRALRALLGDKGVRKIDDSVKALGKAYREGAGPAEPDEDPKRVPHRVVEDGVRHRDDDRDDDDDDDDAGAA
jgi:hypothetical protein